MNHQTLVNKSVRHIQQILREKAPHASVYLFGSRARGEMGRASDFDIWLDGDVTQATLSEIAEEFSESFIPFEVNIVTTADLRGGFGQQVRQDSIPWN